MVFTLNSRPSFKFIPTLNLITSMRRRLLRLAPLFYFAHHLARPTTLRFDQSISDQEKILMASQILDANNRELITYKSFRKPQEAELLPFVISSFEQDYPIILTRFQGRYYAFSALCTYDLETDLSHGICFGNKLYCPKHGCQYDVTNGWTEGAPAIDNLAIFGVKEFEDRIEVYAPRLIPKKVIPQYGFRDLNDLRKVLVYGRGAAAYGLLAGLKENMYFGELTLVTDDSYLPYDRTKMTKRIKATKPEDFLFRSPAWYETTGIDVIFGRQLQYINCKHNNNFAELEDGSKVAFDAFILASGTTPCHQSIPGLESQNAMYLTSMEEHQRLKERLKVTKNLTILGISTESLEVASTIKQEYPQVNVNVIDPNEESKFLRTFGPQLNDLVLNLHVAHGVNVYENTQIKQFTEDKIIFKDDYQLPSDTVLLFPNTKVPNTEFAEASESSFEFDSTGRIKADFNQRTEVKRVFAAGSCAASFYQTNGVSHHAQEWTAAFYQGLTAAYNVLALNVPWHHIPFTFTEQFGKVIQTSSHWEEFDEVYIEGDLKNWDFLIYYGLNDFIVGAAGTPSKQNRVAIINEAIRCANLPFFSEVKSGKYKSEDVLKSLRRLNKSGCYKNELYRVRNDFVPEFNIWTWRDNMSKVYRPWVDTMLSYNSHPKGTED